MSVTASQPPSRSVQPGLQVGSGHFESWTAANGLTGTGDTGKAATLHHDPDSDHTDSGRVRTGDRRHLALCL